MLFSIKAPGCLVLREAQRVFSKFHFLASLIYFPLISVLSTGALEHHSGFEKGGAAIVWY